MTLIEIMIVVAIIAMITSGIALSAFRTSEKAKLKHAVSSARVIRTAVRTYFTLENTRHCPTLTDLLDAQILDEGEQETDPWNQPWKIQCEGSRVIVSSHGPDGEPETPDDIFVPTKRQDDKD